MKATDQAFPGLEGTSGYGNSFPVTGPNGDLIWINTNGGIDLRTYLAGVALPQCISKWNDPKGSFATEAAFDAVTYADALILELNKPKL